MKKPLAIFAFVVCLASFADAQEDLDDEIPVEKFEDYLKSHGKEQSLGVILRQSEKSDNNFYPKYMKGHGIKNFCVTSRPDYHPCLGNYKVPGFSSPEGHRISYYVWESDSKAAVGFYISTHRSKALKSTYEFEDIKNLEKLRIFDHGVSNLADAFYETRQLVELDVSSNEIKKLSGQNFAWVEDLQELCLASNAISSIKEDTFSSPKALKKLDLSGNPLTSLNWGVFTGQKNLLTLFLNGSNLEIIDGFSDKRDTTYDGSTDVQELQGMGDNRPFVDTLGNLTRLDLQNNKLQVIKKSLIERIPNVEHLDLSNNLIESLGKNSFASLRKLKTLLLNDNHLQLPHKEWFSTIIANTRGGQTTLLNVSNNHWKCNCQAITFFDFCSKNLDGENLRQLAQSTRILCFLPESMRGKLLHEIAEEIRVDNECPQASNEESKEHSRPYESTRERQYDRKGEPSETFGFNVDRYVAVALIFALLIAFLAHTFFQYLARRQNMKLKNLLDPHPPRYSPRPSADLTTRNADNRRHETTESTNT